MITGSRPLRILYVIDTLSVGGAERSLETMIPLLRNIDCAVCHLFPGDQLKPTLLASGIPVISLDLPGRYPLRRAADALRGVIESLQPDIIHSTLFRSDIVARFMSRMCHVPLLNSLVNESYAVARFSQLSSSVRLKFRIVQAVDCLTSPMAFHFVANSHAIKAANSRALHIAPAKISVVYRGRDPADFPPKRSQTDARLRSEFGLHPAERILLNIGRLVLAKNQIELIHAMPAILRAEPSCRLFIAGEGPERTTLQAAIDDLGLNERVRLLGNRTDIPDLLALADLFVFPSLYEGHPGAIVEAMYSALPIVASDIAVHRETLLNGALGLLTPLGQQTPLVDNTVRLLRNRALARDLGACARASARQRFDIHRIAEQYEQLYRSLVERWADVR